MYLQGYEDWLRYRTDQIANHQPCLVIRNGALAKIRTSDIEVISLECKNVFHLNLFTANIDLDFHINLKDHFTFSVVGQIGDVIKVEKDEDIPCDMVILSSSEEDGSCYITTVNMDGETNLKASIL